MMTTTDKLWHARYEGLRKRERDAIDAASHQVMRTLRDNGITAAADDRAEIMVAALTRYMIESRLR